MSLSILSPHHQDKIYSLNPFAGIKQENNETDQPLKKTERHQESKAKLESEKGGKSDQKVGKTKTESAEDSEKSDIDIF